MQCEDIPINPNTSNAGGWWLLGIAVLILTVEIVLIHQKKPTISQWIKRKTKNKPLWKVFGISSVGLILWHLFFGGPI